MYVYVTVHMYIIYTYNFIICNLFWKSTEMSVASELGNVTEIYIAIITNNILKCWNMDLINSLFGDTIKADNFSKLGLKSQRVEWET